MSVMLFSEQEGEIMARMSTHHEGGKEASMVRRKLGGKSILCAVTLGGVTHPIPPPSPYLHILANLLSGSRLLL